MQKYILTRYTYPAAGPIRRVLLHCILVMDVRMQLLRIIFWLTPETKLHIVQLQLLIILPQTFHQTLMTFTLKQISLIAWLKETVQTIIILLNGSQQETIYIVILSCRILVT